MQERSHHSKILPHEQGGAHTPPRATHAVQAALLAAGPGAAFLLTPAPAPDTPVNALLAQDGQAGLAGWGESATGAPLDSSDELAVQERLLAHPRSEHELCSALAFDFDEERFDYGDIVLAAIAWREWARLERAVAESLACAAAAARGDAQLEDGAIERAVASFRSTRGLRADEDYVGWLEARSLSADDVREHFSGVLLRQCHALPEELHGAQAADSAQSPAAISNELKLGDWLAHWVSRLARCVAAARALELEGCPCESAREDAVTQLVDAAHALPASGLSERDARSRAPRLVGVLAAEAVFHARCAPDPRIDERIAAHRLDWQRMVWEEVAFRAEGAAREAAMCVRHDGLTLADAARRAHGSAQLREAYCAAEPQLSAALVAALPGELVGPLERQGTWRLLCLRERTAPRVEDPTMREMARLELFEDALARHMAGHISWHGEQ